MLWPGWCLARRLDFFQAVEMAAMQGARDYHNDIGGVEGLVRRTFTARLPAWLHRQLVLPSCQQDGREVPGCLGHTVGNEACLAVGHCYLRAGNSLYT